MTTTLRRQDSASPVLATFRRSSRARLLACAASLSLLSLGLGTAARARQVVPPLGGEGQVNVQSQGDQTDPAIAADGRGNYAIVWITADGSIRPRLYVRLFDPLGAPRGAEIRVDDVELSWATLQSVRVAMAADGRFVVAWCAQQAQARLFDAEGVALGASFQLSDTPPTPYTPAEVAMTADGRFVAAWSGAVGTPSFFLRAFDAQGNPLEAGRRIDEAVPGTPQFIRLATTPGGGVIAAFTRRRVANVNQFDDRLVAVLRPTLTATPGSEIQLNTTTGENHWRPELAVHADGTFSVVWNGVVYRNTLHPNDRVAVRARRFNALGAPLGPEVTLPFDRQYSYYRPMSLASDRFGNTLVAIDDERKLESRLFGPDWTALGDPFELVTYPLDNQAAPALAASGDGFVAAWTSGFINLFGIPIPVITQDGDGFGIFARRFGAPLCATGSTTLCLGPNGRFELSATWITPAGEHGDGRAHPISGDTGAFWFFGPSNLEVLTKLLDGRGINEHYWYFSGALSNLDYTVKVRDTASGQEKSYHNPQGQLASRSDIEAFLGAVPAGLKEEGLAVELPVPSASISGASSSELSCADADPAALCLPLDHIFQVTVEFTDPRTGQRGTARPLALTDNTGAFSFFDAGNLELVVKVLDGRQISGSFWLFYGGLSDLEYTITIRDLTTRGVRFYGNPRGQVESRVDTQAFPN